MTNASTIDPAQLHSELLTSDQQSILLDVRSPAEFETKHIPGSVNVPLDQLKQQRPGPMDTDGPHIVVVCQSGGRAREAAGHLSAHGLGNVRVLDGGLNSWSNANGPTTEGRQAWSIERQVRLVAGSIVFSSITASTLAPRAKWIAAGIGAGLTFAALSDTCAMGSALARMPWNKRGGPTTTLAQALRL